MYVLLKGAAVSQSLRNPYVHADDTLWVSQNDKLRLNSVA
jgi:hypothetical protein